MVRISANGDILPDAPKQPPQQRYDSAPSQRPQQGGYGQIRHADDNVQGAGNNGMASVFDNLNNRLLEAGIPRWNAGPYVVEPIVSMGFVLAGLLIGWHGLIFAALLFFISKYSMSQGPNPFSTGQQRAPRRPGPPPGRGGGGGGGQGGGNRLGRL